MKNALMYILGACLLAFSGCSQEIIEPEHYGSIEGTVINSLTNNGIQSVSIETSPATEVVLTGNKGQFKLTEVPTGKYVIKANKPEFGLKSVNVLVREGEVSSAKIVLEADGQNSSASLKADVTSWYQTGASDSSFVEIEYRVHNTSSSTMLKHFEVYFDIHNNRETLFYEVADTALNAGETDFGSFRKFVRDVTVDSVVVSGTWVKESSG
ncbi:MAG TPA: carboxypeptidase-like regulatory domain-containing protein [Balneolaceae bacterium]|nr:carboxypeptidase-like regulatory domain-containing protein [Balneolaceae bacterium]